MLQNFGKSLSPNHFEIGSNEKRKFQAPKTKSQTNIEIWDLFGIWCLRIGIFLSYKTF
jgi:hypothetical protein